jgi:hypothetical protein
MSKKESATKDHQKSSNKIDELLSSGQITNAVEFYNYFKNNRQTNDDSAGKSQNQSSNSVINLSRTKSSKLKKNTLNDYASILNKNEEEVEGESLIETENAFHHQHNNNKNKQNRHSMNLTTRPSNLTTGNRGINTQISYPKPNMNNSIRNKQSKNNNNKKKPSLKSSSSSSSLISLTMPSKNQNQTAKITPASKFNAYLIDIKETNNQTDTPPSNDTLLKYISPSLSPLPPPQQLSISRKKPSKQLPHSKSQTQLIEQNFSTLNSHPTVNNPIVRSKSFTVPNNSMTSGTLKGLNLNEQIINEQDTVHQSSNSVKNEVKDDYELLTGNDLNSINNLNTLPTSLTTLQHETPLIDDSTYYQKYKAQKKITSHIASNSQQHSTSKQTFNCESDRKKEEAINRIIRNERIKQIRIKIYEYELLKEYEVTPAPSHINNIKQSSHDENNDQKVDEDDVNDDDYNPNDDIFKSIFSNSLFDEYESINLPVNLSNVDDDDEDDDDNYESGFEDNDSVKLKKLSYKQQIESNHNRYDDKYLSCTTHKTNNSNIKPLKEGHEVYRIGNNSDTTFELISSDSRFQLKCSIISSEVKNIINVLKQVIIYKIVYLGL